MTLPDGTVLELFGSGGGEAVAASLSRLTGTTVPLLGRCPLEVELRTAGDAGVPLVLARRDQPGHRGTARGGRRAGRAEPPAGRGVAGHRTDRPSGSAPAV